LPVISSITDPSSYSTETFISNLISTSQPSETVLRVKRSDLTNRTQITQGGTSSCLRNRRACI
jgi:hypothetical protein